MRENVTNDLSLIRRFVADNGYEIIVLSDGNPSAFPMDTAEVLAAIDRIEKALKCERT